MEYIKKDMDSYRLHIIKTDNFKTTTFRISFKTKAKKEEITIRNFLTNFLMYSTDTYPTKRELIIKCEELYGVEIYTRSNRLGYMDNTEIFMTMLDEKYTEKGMLEKSLKFLNDIIFNPNFKKDEYNLAYKFLYKQYERNIKNFKESKSSYSITRMLEEMGKNEIYGNNEIGNMDDLAEINKEKLIAYYNKLINESVIDIYVIGNQDISEEIITKYFPFKKRKNIKFDLIHTHEKIVNKIKNVREEDNSTQSKLAIGCMIDTLTPFERKYVLNIYNSILGGGSESKFFNIIREKESLAYYASSYLHKLDSIMIIKAGISKDNYEKVVKLVKKLMNEMKLGKFSQNDIKIVQEKYIASIEEYTDSEEGILDLYFAEDTLGLDKVEKRIQEIMKVTAEDIINISKKISINTIFLLEGIGE